MATNTKGRLKKKTRKTAVIAIQKIMAAVSLLSLGVVTVSGVISHVGTITIAYRAAAVILVIMMVGRVVVRILQSYEDIHGSET